MIDIIILLCNIITGAVLVGTFIFALTGLYRARNMHGGYVVMSPKYLKWCLKAVLFLTIAFGVLFFGG